MNQLKRLTVIGIIFVVVLGIISHFVYEWSGNLFLAGFFFPVNESIWEHMKLIFFPTLIYSFYMDYKTKKEYPCISSSLYLGIIAGTLSIPVIYYTYSGILGNDNHILNIATFIISVLIAFFTVYHFTMSCGFASRINFLKLLVIILAICFFLFTYLPPDLGIFAEPKKNLSTCLPIPDIHE